MTTSTTPTTPTTTTVTTPTTPTTTTAKVISQNANITMDMDYQDSYNDPTNEVYKDVYNAIESTCKNSISGCSVSTLSFKSGSTIAVYTVSAPSLSDPNMTQVKNGVFSQLALKYPVVFDSDTTLVFQPQTIYIGYIANVKCGPPPPNIMIESNWEAVWTVNGTNITADAQHSFTKTDGASQLVVSKFSEKDNGNYECKLMGKNGPIFRQTGSYTANYKNDVQDNAILQAVQDLFVQSKILNEQTLPVFLAQLSNVSVNNSNVITRSAATIKAIVNILANVANTSSSLSISINRDVMTDVLKTADVLTSNDAIDSWSTLNTNDTQNNTDAKSSSSSFLQSLEIITSHLTNDSFNIDTPLILLNKTTFTDTFSSDFNSSVVVDIPESDGINKTITVITFASMNNVLPPRDKVNSSVNVINGKVVLIQSNGTKNNISITFDTLNDTLGNPQCVFWNFSLYDGLGGWDTEGCFLVFNVNKTVRCNCNHLTSLSILMSPNSDDSDAMTYITYIGVGISMGSLVICLIIEGVIWKKIRRNTTSYLRHVSIVNIAVSLLIADIWFIIGAAISKKTNTSACTAAVFFIHFFYLALFFWMLASALLLLYRTISVFDGGLSKMSMLAIGFSLGYGAPLIIAVITVAVTAPKNTYIRENAICWLNWDESKALLAFVIPALLIVVINLIILFVVIYKMLRRRVSTTASQAGEKHVLLVIVRSLAVLTPIFGLTWGLGVGTMLNPNEGIHIAFAFFNSLQGFFILVFGTLLDKKVRSEIAAMSQSSQSGTRSTSGGISFSKLGFLRLLRRGKGSSGGYNVSSNLSNDSFNNT
ncbi:adhesion G protein-coupled receptor F4-like [Melanotaenia boesemani]|uniref:adhesion G protein-coupled receptor F4-like n=1 Tax=Melanotaenia boesemani TaxID=1250792 RepID=UPI001C05BF67|nr:adhesion G protein-coupled receptor F4-like [Melanotaenia boesemani]